MIKFKDRVIPNDDRIDIMSIINLIQKDLDEIRKSHLVDGGIKIFLTESLIFRLVQWKCKWVDLGYININYGVDCAGRKDLDIDGQIFGCEIRLLHQWEMDIANAYRIQFVECNSIPLDLKAPILKWAHQIYGITTMTPEEYKYDLEDLKVMDYVFLNSNYIKRADGKYIASAVNSYFDIEKVIFNGPATIVVWKDGTKTIVKCEEGTTYSKEEAIDQAILKKLFLTNSHHKRVLKDLISEKSVEQNNKKKLKKEHTNYIQEAVANYINGKTEE